LGVRSVRHVVTRKLPQDVSAPPNGRLNLHKTAKMCCQFVVLTRPRTSRRASNWVMSECLVLWGLASVWHALTARKDCGGLPYNTAIFVVFVENRTR